MLCTESRHRVLLLKTESVELKHRDQCSGIVRCLSGSHSQWKTNSEKQSPSPTASRTSVLVSNYPQCSLAALSAACLLGIDICISLTDRGLTVFIQLKAFQFNFNSSNPVGWPHFFPSCSLLPLLLKTLLPVCICSPLKLTCLHRLTALHGARDTRDR